MGTVPREESSKQLGL
jgi:hypothetical protein